MTKNDKVADLGDAFATEIDLVLTLFDGDLTYADIINMDRYTMRGLVKARKESRQSRRKATDNVDKIVADFMKGKSK